jgi:hypothetical protein
MAEETKNVQEQEEEEKAVNPAMNLLEQLKGLKDEIRAENDRREKLLREEQELHVIQSVSGRAEAGKIPEPPKEETPQEYAKKVMANSI